MKLTTMRPAVFCLALLSVANAATNVCHSRDQTKKSHKECGEAYNDRNDCMQDLDCMWADGPWKDDSNGFCASSGRCKTETPPDIVPDARSAAVSGEKVIKQYSWNGSQNVNCRMATDAMSCYSVQPIDLGGGRRTRGCEWGVEEKDCQNLRYKSFCEGRHYCDWEAKEVASNPAGSCIDLPRCFSGTDADGQKTNPYCRFYTDQAQCEDKDSYIDPATGKTVPDCNWSADENETDCNIGDYEKCARETWCHWGKGADVIYEPQCDVEALKNGFFFLESDNSPYDFLGRTCVKALVFEATWDKDDTQDEHCECFTKIPRDVVEYHRDLLNCYTPDHAHWGNFMRANGGMMPKDPTIYEAMTWRMCSPVGGCGNEIACENGGTPIGEPGKCECQCMDGYAGKNCEEAVSPEGCEQWGDAMSCGSNGCEWDYNSNACGDIQSIPDCSPATKAAACAKLTGCEWDPLDKACVLPIPPHPCNDFSASAKTCGKAKNFNCSYKKVSQTCKKELDTSTGKKVKNCVVKEGSVPLCVNEEDRPDCIRLGAKSCPLWTHCLYHPQHKALEGYETCLPSSEPFACNGASTSACKFGATCVSMVWRTESKKKACYDKTFVPEMPICEGLSAKECKKFYFRSQQDGSTVKTKAKKVCAYDKGSKVCAVVDPDQYKKR